MTTNTTPIGYADLLKYADLQMAAEAFLAVDPVGAIDTTSPLKPILQDALTDGNFHASKFTEAQAKRFLQHWAVEAQLPNTPTGLSATVFRCHTDDPLTGAKAGEYVLSIRSTEFVDDYARDNVATNTLEVKNTGFAWGQLRDLESWYQRLRQPGGLLAGKVFSVTGYSLGGHLATAFNEMHSDEIARVVTFNSGPRGQVLNLYPPHSTYRFEPEPSSGQEAAHYPADADPNFAVQAFARLHTGAG